MRTTREKEVKRRQCCVVVSDKKCLRRRLPNWLGISVTKLPRKAARQKKMVEVSWHEEGVYSEGVLRAVGCPLLHLLPMSRELANSLLVSITGDGPLGAGLLVLFQPVHVLADSRVAPRQKPAKLFLSFLFFDPVTPILEAVDVHAVEGAPVEHILIELCHILLPRRGARP